MTTGQVARAVGFSDEMIRRWSVEEGLPHTVVDGSRRYRLDEVRTWIAAQGKGQSTVGGKKPGAGRPRGSRKAAAGAPGAPELAPQTLDLSEYLETPEGLRKLLARKDLDKATASKAHETLRAGRLMLEYQQAAGELLKVADVELAWAEALQVWKMRLEDASRRMAEEALGACGLGPEQHETLRAILDRQMGSLIADLAADPLGTAGLDAGSRRAG